MGKSSELFSRIAARCPFATGNGKWMAWITAEMEKTEDFEAKVLALSRLEEDERNRHKREKDNLAEKRNELQQYCDHEMHRGTAEDEPVCKVCGWSEPPYRMS